MQKGFLLVLVLLFVNVVQAYPLNPNLDITPSSVCDTDNPDFREYRYKERIPYCTRNVSTQLKAYIYDLYEIPQRCRKNYTIDHFIPLSIGGDNTIENLWPEHKSIKADRPDLEFKVYQDLAKGRIKQERAIDIIYTEKTSYGKHLFTADCN